ncbi:hypothetical protein CABS03_03032 [Colletotrichum abscissum]|uniref:Uncharacterized protein n=2 Tax=Colletotrichum acutatum species complex TaxID=2707335 RepID=A0A9Q0B359_9PEZI|nr:hypothetical protein CABS02_04176 [Colletotrichum abscissum]KAK0380709.1 hypothetical protein CLIM01_01886 [Colletotrichum limetticola]
MRGTLCRLVEVLSSFERSAGAAKL